jgi:iron complex transport system ATP-binding protein
LALAQDAKTLLLDEPTTFLDVHYQLQFLDLLKGLNKDQKLSIITVIHDVNLAARYCDRIAVLKDGSLIALDSPDNVLTSELMKEAFKVETCQIETPIGLQVYTIKSC